MLVCRRLPAGAMELLERHFDLTVNPHDRPLGREELLALAPGREGLLTLLTDAVDAELLQAAGPGLRLVANYAVGYNNLDLDALTARGVAATNTPGVLTEATADLTLALILAAARRVAEGDALMRAGGFPGWGPEFMLGAEVHRRTLGIVGLGRIGRAVARRARGFEMEVLYHSRTPLAPEEEARLGIGRAGLGGLLAASDFVSLHVPLTPGTRRLIGRAELAAMKASAFLINTSRGEVVDEAALAEALAAGRLAGAGLDVYEREPRVHPGLRQLPQVVLLPHLGSATGPTRTAMGRKAAENLIALLVEGRRPPDLLNPAALEGPGRAGS